MNLNSYIALLIVCIAITSCTKQEYQKKAIGEITKIDIAGRGGTYWKFLSNGTEYQAYYPWKRRGLCIGDKFELSYDSLNPKNILINTWKPFFDSTDAVDTVMAKVIRIFWHGKIESGPSHAIVYEYEIGGKLFEKTQELPPGYSIENLIENNFYKAIYNIDQPCISKMNID
jgi:hypothetical protein